MRQAIAIAVLLPIVFATGCDEPDAWHARTDNNIGEQPAGGGIVVIHNGGGQAVLTGLVNAPVAPEAITIGLGGAAPGVSVIDLDGFGQGTGDINTTRFSLNPNIGLPGLTPTLYPGITNFDAGGAGALTLTQDPNGATLLLGTAVGDITDMALGQPLDLVFNDANINPYAGAANQVNPATGLPMPGNTIMVAPHPNPPRLVLPPPNPAMGIDAEEPSVASTFGPVYPFRPTSPPCIASPPNLLLPGNPFSSQPGELGTFGASFPGVFYGPQPPPPVPVPGFRPFVSRQQIGHFLYLLDRTNRLIAVVNSNRFTVLAAIAMPDPIDLAMSPDLELLAVSNAATGDVRFIDANPLSPTFHQVVAQTQLQPGVAELAWQPEGEDLLALNPQAGTLTLIDGQSLQPRKVLTRRLTAPIGLAVSARQTTFGMQTNTWFAFVLNADGSVAVFESGPSGVGGIGYDDVLSLATPRFPQARAIAIDPALGAGFFVAHRDAFGLGQISRVQLVQASIGPQPLPVVPAQNDVTDLPFRGKVWRVTQRFGGANATTPVPTLLAGNLIVDLAFDEIANQGAWPDQRSPFMPGIRYANHSGKGLVKNANGTAVAARSPRMLFLACADTGMVDVIELASGNRLASVPAPGIASLCDYWRQ